jgi:hypothetical protein
MMSFWLCCGALVVGGKSLGSSGLGVPVTFPRWWEVVREHVDLSFTSILVAYGTDKNV